MGAVLPPRLLYIFFSSLKIFKVIKKYKVEDVVLGTYEGILRVKIRIGPLP